MLPSLSVNPMSTSDDRLCIKSGSRAELQGCICDGIHVDAMRQ